MTRGVSPATLLSFLLGRREAIFTIAKAPAALWLGMIFVFSAAFAREYDGQDLLAAPWHLFIPLVASLATSFLLFLVLFTLAQGLHGAPPNFLGAYRGFLTLYWMTAPLAWLYALPVERFLSAGDSMSANLCLLATVATWRVYLMIRVAATLFNARPISVLWPIMLFADSVVVVVIFNTPVPILNFMGGIRLSEREAIIQSAVYNVGFLSVVTWLIWFVGTLAVSKGAHWRYALSGDEDATGIHWSAWCLGGLSLAVWLFVLPVTQSEQRLRHHVEADLATGHIEAAVRTMSAHVPSDFPHHWEPGPQIAYSDTTVPLLDVVEAATEPDVAPWVRTIYVDKLENQLRDFLWPEDNRKELSRLQKVLERLPNGRQLALADVERLQNLSRHYPNETAVHEAAEVLIKWSGYEPPPSSTMPENP